MRLPDTLILALLLLAIVACSPDGQFSSTSGTNQAEFVDPLLDPVRLAWFYKPPSNGDLHSLQNHFGTFVLTALDEPVREALREQGVNGPFMQYLRFDAIHDPGTCDAQPWRNQVANRPGDFCEILNEHPEWFLRDASGTIVAGNTLGERFVMMDPAQQEWREFWLERAKQDQESLGWDGVFLDNVEGSLGKFRRWEVELEAYPSDESYQEAVRGFLRYLHEEYFDPTGRPVFANIVESETAARPPEYLHHLDGYMDEAWAIGWPTLESNEREWEADLARVEAAQAAGKAVILVAQGEQSEVERQQFAFASYLLVADEQTSFRYTHNDAYNEIWLYSNYEANLGAPLRARYQDGNLWRRDFTRGTITVDPARRRATITIY